MIFFIPPPLHSAPPLGSPRRNVASVWYGKTRMVGLPDGEKTLRIRITVYTQYRRVTDRQTDGLTDGQTDKQISCHGIDRIDALEALFATMRYINWHLHLHYRAMHTRRAVKTRMVHGTIIQWKNENTFSRFHAIPAYVRQIDGRIDWQTSCDSNVRAMHSIAW